MKVLSRLPNLQCLHASRTQINGNIEAVAGCAGAISNIFMRSCEAIAGDIDVFGGCDKLRHLCLQSCPNVYGSIRVFQRMPKVS